MMRIGAYFKAFVGLFFPDCCFGCDQPLLKDEHLICQQCRYQIPYTGFHADNDNDGARLLWGQFPAQSVLSYLYFDDKSRVQRMIHHMKYFNRPELAYQFGREYAHVLMESGHSCLNADAIVPVPMSSKKLAKRTYNQSEVFANGLASMLDMPVLPDVLLRKQGSKTQVGKGRSDRYDNLAEAILAGNLETVSGKNILLVDDVLTSGATIVACAEVLLTASVERISVVTIARKR